MRPVFMENDIGGIVYVGKNEVCLRFFCGVEYTIRPNTKQLLEYLEQRKEPEFPGQHFTFEQFSDPQDKSLLIIITISSTDQDLDTATVFCCDLVEALKTIECYA